MRVSKKEPVASSNVQVELLEATAHGPATRTLCDAPAVLLADESVNAARTETAYAFRTCIAFSQHAESPAAGAVYLDMIREHW